MAKKKLFNKFKMKLTKVHPTGTEKEPKAYVYLEADLEAEDLERLGLTSLNEISIIDRDKMVHLKPAAIPYGEGFTLELALAPQKDDQEEMFDPAVIIEEVIPEKLASVALTKHTLTQSILLALENSDVLYQILEYAGKKVYVTITFGKAVKDEDPNQTQIEE